MLTTIIFSKDRPLQLDLCLKSIAKNWITNNITVIFKCSSYEYLEAYKQLKNEHNNIYFLYQQNSLTEILHTELINLHNCKYISFLTDDNIVYRKCLNTTEDIDSHFEKSQIDCFSFRLGINITHQNNNKIQQPVFGKLNNNTLCWNRCLHLPHTYWNYPLSVDGHIFQTSLIKKIWEDLQHKSINTPNKFEILLQRYFFEIGPIMSCEIYSNVVNTPNNRVQEEAPNWFGHIYNLHQNDLLKLYSEGKRIDFEKLSFNINTPHQEINLLESLT